mmetsp:Transcript_25587/g.40094  ORF Transcript_25587/g.40094 Transcript_25587/m.40094 type:complete len:274 (-) Transcript_25587:256-1077(-)
MIHKGLCESAVLMLLENELLASFRLRQKVRIHICSLTFHGSYLSRYSSRSLAVFRHWSADTIFKFHEAVGFLFELFNLSIRIILHISQYLPNIQKFPDTSYNLVKDAYPQGHCGNCDYSHRQAAVSDVTIGVPQHERKQCAHQEGLDNTAKEEFELRVRLRRRKKDSLGKVYDCQCCRNSLHILQGEAKSNRHLLRHDNGPIIPYLHPVSLEEFSKHEKKQLCSTKERCLSWHCLPLSNRSTARWETELTHGLKPATLLVVFGVFKLCVRFCF